MAFHLVDVPHPEYILDVKRARVLLAELKEIKQPGVAVLKIIARYEKRIALLGKPPPTPES
jgi:hypothetical protein